MQSQSSQSSLDNYTSDTPYDDIRPDQVMSLAHAQACFDGDRSFTAFTNYWVTTLDDQGDIRRTPYTAAISNHQPNRAYQSVINLYVSFAGQDPDPDFLTAQKERMMELHRVREQSVTNYDVSTWWGAIAPEDLIALSRREHRRTWDSMLAQEQSQQALIATTVGAIATSGSRRGNFTPPNEEATLATEFCGVTPCSLVEPAIWDFIGQNGEIKSGISIRHHPNFYDPAANRLAVGLVPSPERMAEGMTYVDVLSRMEHRIQRLNESRAAWDRIWVKAKHELLNKIADSDICNARYYGGIGGVSVKQVSGDRQSTSRVSSRTYSKPA